MGILVRALRHPVIVLADEEYREQMDALRGGLEAIGMRVSGLERGRRDAAYAMSQIAEHLKRVENRPPGRLRRFLNWWLAV